MDEQDEGAKRRDYVVTERAGPRVAGRHAAAGNVMALTDGEAEYELREGTIAPKGRAPSKAFERSSTADALRKDAKAVKAAAEAAPAVVDPPSTTA